MVTPLPGNFEPRDAIAREAVLEHLNRLLKHPAFASSHRSTRFLRCIVEHRLQRENKGEPLKERMLGRELFGLDAAYDTNQFPVVRHTATDVRKRLAQYYSESGHEDELRIELPVGSYIPNVYPPIRGREEGKLLGQSNVARAERASSEAELPIVPKRKKAFPRQSWWFLLTAAILLVFGIGFMAYRHTSFLMSHMSDAGVVEQFWLPVLKDNSPPVILVYDEVPLQQDPFVHAQEDVSSEEMMTVGDSMALLALVHWLDGVSKRYRISASDSLTMDDFQSSTIIVVGGNASKCVTQVIGDLRFHFSSQVVADSKTLAWIADRKNPSRRFFSTQPSASPKAMLEEFAIVARMKDQKNGRWRVVVAGLEPIGTLVVARFLLDSNSSAMEFTSELNKQLPKGWSNKNLEAVIAVQVINGKAGFPRLVDLEVW
jgi:hypothetical protein